MIDNHIHTKLCKHAEGEVFEYVEKAISNGINEIAFTDHIPLPNNFDLAHRMQQNEMEIYTKWIEKARNNYPEITILFGIEADFYEGFEEYTESFISQYNFDIVIMSVHFIRHWPEGNWVFDYSFSDKSREDIYKDYLITVIKGIETGLFDVLGHVDMIKIFGDSLIRLIPSEVDILLEALKEHDMSIEINSSGYRKKVKEPYPGLDWLPFIKEKSIPLTTGSDAHHPDQVGLGFESLYKRLHDEGIDRLVTYKKRQKIEIQIK
jgi:histidinol-phosphatase (PHP family)